jgi:hypothetical protein
MDGSWIFYIFSHSKIEFINKGFHFYISFIFIIQLNLSEWIFNSKLKMFLSTECLQIFLTFSIYLYSVKNRAD